MFEVDSSVPEVVDSPRSLRFLTSALRRFHGGTGLRRHRVDLRLSHGGLCRRGLSGIAAGAPYRHPSHCAKDEDLFHF